MLIRHAIALMILKVMIKAVGDTRTLLSKAAHALQSCQSIADLLHAITSNDGGVAVKVYHTKLLSREKPVLSG
jgi:hypothetical protein